MINEHSFDENMHQLREKIDEGRFENTIGDWLRVYRAVETVRGSIDPNFVKHNTVSDGAKNDFNHILGKLGYDPKSSEIVEDFVFRNGTAAAKRSQRDWNDVCVSDDLGIHMDLSHTSYLPDISSVPNVNPTDIVQNLTVGNKEMTDADKQFINEYFQSKWHDVEKATSQNTKFVDKRRSDINSGKYEKYLNEQEVELAKCDDKYVPMIFNKQELNQMLDEYVKQYNSTIYDINSTDVYHEAYVFEHTDLHALPERTRESIGNINTVITSNTRAMLGDDYKKYCQDMDDAYKNATEPSFYFDRAYRDDPNGFQDDFSRMNDVHYIFTPIRIYGQCMDELKSKKREELENQQVSPRPKRRLPDIVETTDDEQSLEVE